MPTYKVEGIVLRRTALGEADQIITLFTRHSGKVRAVAKGVRRPGSRLAAGVQPFTYGQYEIWQGRNLDGIRQAQVDNSFPRLRQDLSRLTAASYMAELTDQLTADRDPAPRHFVLLLRSLATLEDGGDPSLLLAFFQIRSLAVTGFRPSLAACVQCGTASPAAGAVVLAPVAGGFICDECGTGHGGGPRVRLDDGAWQLLRQLAGSPAVEAVRLEVASAVAARLGGGLDQYIAHQLGRPLKSSAFLDILADDSGEG